MRKLVKDGFIIRKPEKIHSRHRARTAAEAKAKGRHTGYGAFRGWPVLLGCSMLVQDVTAWHDMHVSGIAPAPA